VVTRAVRDGVAASAILLGLALSGCVSDDFPPPPSVEPNPDAGAGPTMLASAPGCGTDPGSIDLVVAEGALFWTEKMTGTVNSVPTRGGSKTVIATGQMSPGPLAVDGTSIYWVEAGKKRIMKKALGDAVAPTVLVEPGTATVVIGDENDINALLVTNGILFFGRFTSALKVPTTGGTPSLIGQSPAPDLGQPAAFAIDATHLYQTELFHYAISREALDGTQDGLTGDTGMTRQRWAPDRIAVSQSQLLTDALAVVNGNVIWVNYNVIESKPVGAGEHDPSFQIVSAPNSGTSPPSITGFVVSDDMVFFGESAFNKVNVVAKVPLSAPHPAFTDAGAVDAGAADAGAVDAAVADADAADAGGLATPVIIATDQQSPSQFAADATNIYWRTTDCKIMKLAK
jgi:hypothetical protein